MFVPSVRSTLRVRFLIPLLSCDRQLSFPPSGHFQYVAEKLPNIVVPDLTDFELKPYVAYGTALVKTAPPTLPELKLNEAEVLISP